MIPMDFEGQGMITFVHLGKRKCPNCGGIGEEKSVLGVDMMACPVCKTEFTEEVIIIDGDEVSIANN